LRLPGHLLPPKLDEGTSLITPDGMTDGQPQADAQRAQGEDGKVVYPGPALDVDQPPPSTLDIAKSTATLGSSASGGLASHPSTELPPFIAKLSQHDFFRSLWSIGEPLLIDLAPENYPSLPWTPDYFIERFGTEVCRIGSTRVMAKGKDGEREKERNGTVGGFFATFGKERDTGDVEKIKVRKSVLSERP
jgi:lysine-specific demethylase 3